MQRVVRWHIYLYMPSEREVCHKETPFCSCRRFNEATANDATAMNRRGVNTITAVSPTWSPIHYRRIQSLLKYERLFHSTLQVNLESNHIRLPLLPRRRANRLRQNIGWSRTIHYSRRRRQQQHYDDDQRWQLKHPVINHTCAAKLSSPDARRLAVEALHIPYTLYLWVWEMRERSPERYFIGLTIHTYIVNTTS